MFRYRTGQTRAASLLALGLFLAGSAPAATPPERGPARSEEYQQTEEHQAPSQPVIESAHEALGPMILFPIPMTDPNDKGSTYTDTGAPGEPATPTPLEQAKLEMARRAIEASRLAGTLSRPADPGPAPVAADAAAQQAKLDLLRSLLPAALVPDEAAGVGVEIPPIQEAGPGDLNEVERAKLAGDPLPASPAAPEETEAAPEPPAKGDGAPEGKEEN